MFAINHPRPPKNSLHRSSGWRRLFQFLICVMLLLCFFDNSAISANAKPRGCNDEAIWTYEEYNETSHYVDCSICREWWVEAHVFDSASDTTCNFCSYTRTLSDKQVGGTPNPPDIHTGDGTTVNTFAWDVYKVLCYLAIPCAIISLAYCGFQFLGAIFTGSYAGPGGGDMQKAQKQVIYTILGVILIFLLPRILEWAINIFKVNAWKPG